MNSHKMFDANPLMALPFNISGLLTTNQLPSAASSHNVTSTASNTMETLSAVAYFIIICYFLLMLVTVTGNLLVILGFWKEPTLQAITNYWIVSLSLTDICLSCTVLPFQVARELNFGRWIYGPVWCDIFIFLDVMCCSCSIYHLALISLDRYLCIRFPVEYPCQRSSRKTIFAISLTWLWCSLLASPRFFGWKDVQHRDRCEMENVSYMIFSSLVSFYIPLFLILCMYFWIYRATQARAHKFRREQMLSQRYPTRTDASVYARKYRADSAPAITTTVTMTKQQFKPFRGGPLYKLRNHSIFAGAGSLRNNKRPSPDIDLDTIPEGTITLNSDESSATINKLPPKRMIKAKDEDDISNLSNLDQDMDMEFSDEMLPNESCDGASRNRRRKTSNEDRTKVNDSPSMLLKSALGNVKKKLSSLAPPVFLERSQTAGALIPSGAGTGGGGHNCLPPTALTLRPDEAYLSHRRCSNVSSKSPDDNGSTLGSESNLVELAAQCANAVGMRREKYSPSGANNSASTSLQVTSTSCHKPSPTGSAGAVAAATLVRTASDAERRQRKLTKAKLKRRRQRQENRTAKVVVFVLGAFVIFWGPFFVVNVWLPLCKRCFSTEVRGAIWKVAVFWGYCNSAVNPFIYTFFNRTFRRAIVSVLQCTRRQRRRPNAQALF